MRGSNVYFLGFPWIKPLNKLCVEGGPFKRGVTESIFYKWIKGVIFSKDIIVVEEFCNISFKKCPQHADSTDARIERDDIDMKKLEEYFIQHSPFPVVAVIMTISTGTTGQENVN